MPDLNYLLNNNNEKAPANAAGASSNYNPFKKLEEDKDMLNTPTIKFLNSDTGLNNNPLNIDYESYTPYNVYINDINTREELNKERAQNQSTWEQGLRSIGQIANEMTVGTAVGIADLGDAIYNILKGDLNFSENDYQSDITLALEDFKKSIDDRLAIYRENPDKAWDITDFAWWASNAPSLASTVSLMVPGLGVTKGLSLLGKGINLISKGSRVAREAKKVRNALLPTQKARSIADAAGKSISSGVTMRLLENYQEARQTSLETEKYSLDKLSKMSKDEKTKFIENNPEYKNWNDEDIAKDIAKHSADITFNEDWVNVFFDIWQVYSLRNLWKNALNGTRTSRLEHLNKLSAQNFGEEGKVLAEISKNASLLDKTKTLAKDFAHDTMHGIKAEWTEGVEEAVNYIAQQDGLYMGKKVFDKNTPYKDMSDYLKDPLLWEQAFWGALGGVAFSGVMNKASSFVNRKFNKEWVSAEKQKENEILNRSVIYKQLQQNLDLISKGKNPFLTYTTKDGKKDFADIQNDLELSNLKNVAIHKYINDLFVNAANTGNIGLLKDFLKDSNIDKVFKDKGIYDELFFNKKELLKNLEFNEQTYSNVINRVNELGGNIDIAKIIATNTLRTKELDRAYFMLSGYNQAIIDNVVNNPDNKLTQDKVLNATIAIAKSKIDNINKTIENIRNNSTLKDNEKKEQISQLESKIEILNDLYSLSIDDETLNEYIKDAKDIMDNNTEAFNAIHQKMNADVDRETSNRKSDTRESNLRNQIVYYNNFFDKARTKIVESSEKDIKDLVHKYGGKIIQKYFDYINNNESFNLEDITEEDYNTLYNAISVLELDKEGNKFLNNRLQLDILMAEAERVQKQNEEVNPQEDDTKNPQEENNINQQQEEETKSNSNTSSTGGRVNQNNTNFNPFEPEPNNTNQANQTNNTNQTNQTSQTSTQNPVGNTQSTSTNASNTNNTNTSNVKTNTIELPENQDERINMMIDEVLKYFQDNNINSDDTIQVQSSISALTKMLEDKGFEKGEIIPIIEGFANSISYSSVNDDEVAKLSYYAGQGILYQDERFFKDLLKNFVESKRPDGTYRGVIVDNHYYVSIAELGAYLKESTNNEFLYKYIFERMRSYLFSDKIREDNIYIIDQETLLNIQSSSGNFVKYIDKYRKERDIRVKGITNNNVNISNLTAGRNFDSFVKLKIGDKLDYKIDKTTGRILLVDNNNTVIGYIGIPVTNNGAYVTNNNKWKYELYHSSNGTIESPVKEAFKQMLVGDINNPINPQFIKLLYDAGINYSDKKSRKGNTYRQDMINIYNMFILLYPNIEYRFVFTANSSKTTTIDNQIEAMQHLTDVAFYALINGTNQEESINNWFNKLFESYDQATSIANGETKGTIVISSMDYGALNNDKNEFNSVKETVVGYDEELNQIGFTHPTKEGRIITYSNDTGSYITGESAGVPYMRIITANGGFVNAQCQLVALKDNPNKDVQNIKTAAETLVKNLITSFINDNTKYNFNSLTKHITDLIGNNSLFDFIDSKNYGIAVVPNSSIGFKVNGKFIFTINASGNIVINDPSIKNLASVITKNNNQIFFKDKINNQQVQDKLENLLGTFFENAIFARSHSLINDRLRKNDDTTNSFVIRKNNKTIIKFDNNNSFEYNSYQDFLVSTDSIKVKLNNEIDNRISGNWKYDVNLTKLNISYEVTKTVSEIVTINEDAISNLFNQSIGSSENFNKFERAIMSNDNVTKGLEEFFKGQTVSSKYIETLKNIGVFPSKIKFADILKTKDGKEVNAEYDNKTDTIILNRHKLTNLTYGRVVRIIIHENIHRLFNNEYGRANNIIKIKEIYNQFREEILNTTDENLKNLGTKYLFTNYIGIDEKVNGNNSNHKIALEEFIVESLTSQDLMTALNSIKYKGKVESKIKNLFTKLLQAIADIFGIKINEDSLLAAARDIYSEYKTLDEKNKNKNNKPKITHPKQKQLEINFTDNDEQNITNNEENINQQENNIPEDNIDNNIDNNIGGFIEDDEDNNNEQYFSDIEDNQSLSIPSLIDMKPLILQPAISEAISTGELSFRCV